MKASVLQKLLLVAFVLCCFSLVTQAQSRISRTKKASSIERDVDQKRISAKDRDAIVALFKDVDPSKYRLQFYNGKRPRTYGKKRYTMSDLNRVKRVTNPVESVGWIVFVVEGDDVIYVLAVGSSDVKSVLGSAKTKRLESIMAKYQ